ncbi:uncharacterized protein LOC143178337 [Calliopsis andreniformis]|uniref:uncharacterized protein LOC143178337 n=1 Tax=Calliopsis andreniformis TaxID=337506 RepID=UPI003FCDA4FB
MQLHLFMGLATNLFSSAGGNAVILRGDDCHNYVRSTERRVIRCFCVRLLSVGPSEVAALGFSGIQSVGGADLKDQESEGVNSLESGKTSSVVLCMTVGHVNTYMRLRSLVWQSSPCS